jgi:hypothetical protein
MKKAILLRKRLSLPRNDLIARAIEPCSLHNINAIKLPSPCARLLLSLFVVCCGLYAGSARATVIFDNLATGNAGFRDISSTSWDAQRFNSDSTDLLLTSATLNLSSGPGSGNFFLSLYSDTSNRPGTLIANLFTGTNSTNGDRTFSGLNQLLLPNTNYWLVLGDTPGATLDVGWGVTTTTTGTGSGFQATAAFSNDSGADWTITNVPQQTQIVASAVPEPRSALLALLGGGGLLLARHFRTRKSR